MIVETVDIVRDLVALLRPKIVIDSIVDNANGTYTIYTCNTKHVNTGLTFSVDDVLYTVQSFVKDESIIVTGESIITGPSFLLDVPKFWHGSILETNKNLTGIAHMDEKVPMVYLRRPYRDSFKAKDSSIERESDVTIYFLTEDLFHKYDIDQRDIECIYPMRSLCYEFIELLRKNSQIAVIGNYDIENKEKFGVVNSKGSEKVLFDTPLSGCELSITIPITKNYKCKC